MKVDLIFLSCQKSSSELHSILRAKMPLLYSMCSIKYYISETYTFYTENYYLESSSVIKRPWDLSRQHGKGVRWWVREHMAVLGFPMRFMPGSNFPTGSVVDTEKNSSCSSGWPSLPQLTCMSFIGTLGWMLQCKHEQGGEWQGHNVIGQWKNCNKSNNYYPHYPWSERLTVHFYPSISSEHNHPRRHCVWQVS